jgi:hypothetical protein
MKKRVSLTRAVTFGMAVLSMPTLALAQTHLGPCNGCGAVRVQLGATGELTGAGVVVPVTVACTANYSSADTEVNLRQPNVAAGQGDLALDGFPEKCPSTPQTVHVLVRPFGQQFELGSATASAALGACDVTGRNCNVPMVKGTIDIVD